MSDGSFLIGGGDWGQTINETILSQLVGSTLDPDRPLEQMERALLRMPVEALRTFEPFLPNARAAAFSSKQGAVQAIMDALLPGPLTQGVLDSVQDLLDRIKEIISNIVTGWVGIDIGTGVWDPLNVHITTQEIAQAIQSLNAQIQEFLSGNNNGVAVTENFNVYPDGGLGTKWATWHTGIGAETIEIKNGRMQLFCFPFTTRRGWARYRSKATDTDYQRVGVVFGSKPMAGLFNATSYNYIVGRLSSQFDSDSTSTMCFAKLGAGQAQIGCRNRGTETIFKTESKFNFNPAASYFLQCGVKGQNGQPDAPFTFRLWEGANLVTEAVDSGQVSFVGTNHRFGGVGFSNDNALQSANVASFTMFDSK